MLLGWDRLGSCFVLFLFVCKISTSVTPESNAVTGTSSLSSDAAQSSGGMLLWHSRDPQ